MENIRDLFLLDPEIIFLNHGSFGATPRPVLNAYQNWQRKLEKQPVKFLAVDLFDHLEFARNSLANYLYTEPEYLAFIPNATFGVNVVARSLNFKNGDEILTSNHEYGACENAWQYVCNQTGAILIRQDIPLPLSEEGEIIDRIFSRVTNHTKLIFISHITSPTAIRFPIEEICRRARELGILTFVDGAHAPGQIDVNLNKIQPDFYTGNCHKWMLAPKGAGFLYANLDVQDFIEPLVVSWGWGGNPDYSSGSRFHDNLQWWGTHDPSAFLSVPEAINFQKKYDWNLIRENCRSMVIETRKKIASLTGMDQICPDTRNWINQMFISRLPTYIQADELKRYLYKNYSIEVPVITWNDHKFIRVSIQGYNTHEDLSTLLVALDEFL